MKRKIILKDNISNKVIEGEVKIRDLDHLQAQQTFKSITIKPKKGKGSYTRKLKHREEYNNEN